MSIIISKDGCNATRVERTVIHEEDYLQRYIHDNPESLPLHELKEDMRLLILVREFAVPSGYIDALGVDADGEIYIIETKLYKNPDKRLVLAQMLDYGASLWKNFSDSNQFIEQLEREAAKHFGVGLAPKLSEFFGFAPEAVPGYLQLLKDVVSKGMFRFVVLMDRIDDRLKDLISFVNANSRFDVLGVELEFYQHKDFEIIIPQLYGAEGKKEVAAAASPKRQWDEAMFFEELQRNRSETEVAAARQILEWATPRATRIYWGQGTKFGSFVPVVSRNGIDHQLLAVFTYGSVEVYFQTLQGRPAFQPEEKRLELLRRLNAIPGVSIPPDGITRRPSIKLATLEGADGVRRFLEVYDWVLEEIEHASRRE
jgi:hypothetical protein